MEVSERLANEQEIEYTRRLATERESRMENGITTGRLKSDFKEEGTGRLDIATSLHAVAFRDFSTTPGFSHRCRSDAITNEDLRYHESLKHSNKKVDAFVILCFCSDEFYLDTFPREPSCHFSIGQFWLGLTRLSSFGFPLQNSCSLVDMAKCCDFTNAKPYQTHSLERDSQFVWCGMCGTIMCVLWEIIFSFTQLVQQLWISYK